MSSQSRHRRSENGGNGHKNLGPKPVEKDKEYNVEIIEKSAKGDCIAKIQGYIIFIPRGEVGQTVKIRVTHVGERAARAELVDNYRDSGSEKNLMWPLPLAKRKSLNYRITRASKIHIPSHDATHYYLSSVIISW